MQSSQDSDPQTSFPSSLDYIRTPSTSTTGRKKRIALVAQGGGQRGVYTAGVLDSFLDAGFDPFEIYIGTSAGALNISSYLTRQRGFGHRFITEYTTQDRFFNLLKYVRRQQFMDLDWALEIMGPTHPSGLAFEKAKAVLANRYAYACVTNTKTLEPDYFHLFEDDWISVLKATCAIPMLYPSSVQISDQYYVDGGVSGAIPAREAFNRGADVIVVIRTEPVAQDRTHISSTFIENIRSRVETRLPEYLTRLSMDDRFERLSEFHQQLSLRLEEVKLRYKEHSHEPLWAKLKEMMPKSAHKNGGRWLYGGDAIYRLHAMSGQKVNSDMLEMMTKHFHSYQDAIHFMSNPPHRAELIQICPSTPLASSALLSKPFQLEHDYQDGLVAGRRFIDEYALTLNDVSTVTR
ncbi:alpha/beta hydrolase [Enterovibrio norvegicus FF-33]|uniref:Alpha/beta hydrolase n=1 Tax=Enterovibrio norvegicus FF-454 TaxID=1185651 RepID=A0A1E5BX62_9GAMM|nr:patatin family protein [Enterovibrio norvegicus]OEE57779.1 alpha/beta hydrolase [Enterovibrio norvegicus FF-454]OEE67548.1 alpha/beta hydrolase [Enterovibrio norvegicus FF-33]